MKKKYIDTPNGSIHYYQGGPEHKAPIVLLHQNVSGAKMYEKTILASCEELHCIAPDLPGFGGSFDPPEIKSISELTIYIHDFIKVLGYKQYHTFGNHTGAGMAAELAAKYPNEVLSCTMIGALLLSSEEAIPFREQFSGSVGPSHDAKYLQATWDYIYNLGGDKDLDNMNDEFYGALRAWKIRGMIYKCVWDYTFQEFLDNLKCPVMLMCATDDVLYLGHQNTARYLKNAKVVDLVGANFEPYFDAKNIAKSMKEFFAENKLEED